MSPRRDRRPVLKVVAALFGIGFLVLVGLFLLRPTINVTLLKRPLENILTEVVESPVTLERVTLRPGFWIDLRLFGLRIESTGTDVAVDFAAIDEAQVRVELLPLFRRELRIDGLAASGIDLRLQVDRRDRGNWPVWETFVWDITRLEGLELGDIQTRYLELSSGREITAEIERITGGIATDVPLSLEISGSTSEVPLAISAVGGTLAELDGPGPWPFTASLVSDTLHLELAGQLPTAGAEAAETRSLSFALFGENLAGHRATSRLALPDDLGAISIEGEIRFGERSVVVSPLEGRFGRSDVSGELRLATGGERPGVDGRLELGTLDLAPWLGAGVSSAAGTEAPSRSLEDLESFSFVELGDALRGLDAKVSVDIDRLEGLPLEVSDLELEVGLTKGALEVPLSLRQAGSDLEGRLRIDASGSEPTLHLELGARALRSENLAALPSVPIPSGIRVGRLTLTASSTGSSAADHLRSLAVDVAGSGAFMTLPWPESGPWSLHLDEAHISQEASGPLELVASGTLDGEPFRLGLETGNFATLVEDATWPFTTWPFTLTASGGGAEIGIEGNLNATRESPALEAGLNVVGDEIGGLAAWLDLAADATHPYSLATELSWSKGTLDVRIEEARLGRTLLSGNVGVETRSDGDWMSVAIRSPMIDIEEVLLVLGAATESGENETGLDLDFDRQILPTEIHLGNGDLDFRIDEISGIDWRLVEVDLPLRLRDGRLERSPFSFGDGQATYDGTLALDLRSETPELDLELHIGQADLERFLEDHEEETGLDFAARAVQLTMQARGSTLGEIITFGAIEATMDDVEWRLGSSETGKATTVLLERVTLRDTEGAPFELAARGTVEGLPLAFRVESDASLDQLRSGARIPLTMEASTEGTDLHLDGFATLPFGSGESELQLTLEGDRLDRVSGLVGMDLPALGPYSLAASWAFDQEGDRLSELQVRIGGSELAGTFALSLGDARPRLDFELAGDRLDLADLVPLPSGGEETTTETPSTEAATTDRGWLDELDALVTEELLGALDARAVIRVNELVSDGVDIGDIELRAQLESGRLEADLTSTQPDKPTSRAKLGLRFENGQIDTSIAARLLRLDYGLIDQILGGKEELDGVLSADLELHAVAPSFAAIPAGLDGTFAFADFPESANATILDLWGGQILRGILPTLLGGEKPRINCTVAQLSLEKGRATTETLYVDSTGSRIRGKGWVDLGSGKLDMVFKPKPKQRGLINLSTTVRVRGDIDDPVIAFTAGGIARTALRIYLWVWTVWRELLLRKPLPADGSDICVDPPAMAFLEEVSPTAE